MQSFLAILSALVLLLGALFAALNWGCVIASYRLYRQGEKRHVSTIPLVPQLCVVVAAVLLSRTASPLLPSWSFWVVALAEPSLFQMAYYPVFVLRRRMRAHPNSVCMDSSRK